MIAALGFTLAIAFFILAIHAGAQMLAHLVKPLVHI